MKKGKMDYKKAGVDIKAGERFVEKVKSLAAKATRAEVLAEIGGFGGMFALDKGRYQNPILVAAVDGVGTKLKVAQMCRRHDTVGVDLVAMCANDILVQGAEPLFFMDYLATGKLKQEEMVEVIDGIAAGCRQAGCALLGGETAEMPGFYGGGEYELAGFCVGIVEKDKIIDGSKIEVGDKVLGLIASGLHSNGFSLVRKVFFDKHKVGIDDVVSPLEVPLGEELLKPTRIYVKSVLMALEEFEVKGIAHITGGGLVGNVPRILPQGVGVKLRKDSWEVPPIFNLIKKEGNIAKGEMFKVFNMGIGMVLIVSPHAVEEVIDLLGKAGERSVLIGEVIKGKGVGIG